MFSIKSIKIERPDSSVMTIENIECHNIEAVQELLKFCNIQNNIIPASSVSMPDLLDLGFDEELNNQNENTELSTNNDPRSSSYNRTYYQKRKDDPYFKKKSAQRAKEYYLKHKDDPEYKQKKSEDNKRRRLEKKNKNSVTIQSEI